MGEDRPGAAGLGPEEVPLEDEVEVVVAQGEFPGPEVVGGPGEADVRDRMATALDLQAVAHVGGEQRLRRGRVGHDQRGRQVAGVAVSPSAIERTPAAVSGQGPA